MKCLNRQRKISMLVIAILSFFIITPCHADTGDVIDDFLEVNTNVYWCSGEVGPVWADVDENGEFDTQIVFTTLTGEAIVIPEHVEGKWYFFSFIDAHCGGLSPYTERGRFKIHFIDILAPDFVWNDPATWTYKSIPSLSIKASHDNCIREGIEYEDAYQLVQAYRELEQTDPITGTSGSSGVWTIYDFSDEAGIKELYVSTDFCENNLDDLILRNAIPAERTEPVDIVVLLDYSDSMNSEAEPGGRDKIEVLKDAAEIFFRTWETFAIAGDRTDVVYFDSDVDPLSIDLRPLIDNVGTIIDEIRTRSTGTYTAMGGAVQVGLSGLSMDANHPAIILFTNGIQNVNPMAVNVVDHYEIVNSPDAWGGTSSVPENPGISLGSYYIPIHIIGIGEAAATSYHGLLSDICIETGGLLHLITAPDDDLRRFFLEDLIEALNLNTLEMVGYKYGSLAPAHSMSETFAIDGAIKKAAFLVHWVDKSDTHFPNIRIDGPHNQNLQPTKWVNGEFYRMAIFDFPYTLNGQPINPVGNWRIYTDESPNENSIAYQATLIVDETVIHYHFNLPVKHYWTGEPIIPTVQVTESTIPLRDLEVVQATLTSPRNPLGTFLSTNPDTDSAPMNDLISTRGQRKLLKLLENPLLRKKLEPKETTLILHDDGNAEEHGDIQQGDGTYSAKVTGTKLPGLYSFEFDVQGKSLTGWPVERTQILSTIVHVKPDSQMSEKMAKWLQKLANGSGTVLITVIPYDKFGNYLGPDYGNAFNVTTSYGDFVGDIYDALDGSYELKLHLPDRSNDPIITINVLDFKVYEDKLSKLFIPDRFGLSIHFGYGIPHVDLNKFYNPNFNCTIDFEFPITNHLSLEALLGYHKFKGDNRPDTYWLNFSGNLKYFPKARRIRPFINGGFGAYKKKNDSTLHFGINGGGGIAFQVRPKLFIESSYNYHTAFSNGSNTNFSTAQIGLRLRF